MSDTFTITVTGLEETARMLEEAPAVIVAEGFFKAGQAAGNVIADVLEVKTPVKKEDTGGLLEAGELREMIQVLTTLDSQLRGVQVQIGFRSPGDHVANWVEYGHDMVTHGGKVIGRVKAYPFMRPTFDVAAEPAIEAFAAVLRNTVEANFVQKFGFAA